MHTMKITIGGAELNMREEGDGDVALVFLHYWGGSSRTWVPVMQRLSDRFRCIAFDQRGWGLSDKSGDYSLSAYADDTRRLIGALGLRRFVLVGHSMGGKIAQMIAQMTAQDDTSGTGHNAGLQGLVLVAPAPAGAMPVPEAQREAMLASYQTREGAEQALTVLAGSPLSTEFRLQVIEDTVCGAPDAKAEWTTRGMIENVARPGASIAVPVSIIVGDRDIVEPEARLRQAVPALAPQARFEVLQGLGHLAPLEDPERVAVAIGNAIATMGKDGRS